MTHPDPLVSTRASAVATLQSKADCARFLTALADALIARDVQRAAALHQHPLIIFHGGETRIEVTVEQTAAALATRCSRFEFAGVAAIKITDVRVSARGADRVQICSRWHYLDAGGAILSHSDLVHYCVFDATLGLRIELIELNSLAFSNPEHFADLGRSRH